jgi:hypothetical protein
MVDRSVMTLLHERIPLTLLWDLCDPGGPRSAEILAVEQGGPFLEAPVRRWAARSS